MNYDTCVNSVQVIVSSLKEHGQSLFEYLAVHSVAWKWRRSLEAVQFD